MTAPAHRALLPALALAAPLGAFAAPSEVQGARAAGASERGRATTLELVDLSESGEAVLFELGTESEGTLEEPIVVRFGATSDWDVTDFEVRGARGGETLHFEVPAPPSAIAPAFSTDGLHWEPAELAGTSGFGFRVVAPRERFLVRLLSERAATPDAAYYDYGRYVAYMEGIGQEPLAQVTRIGTSALGRPLHRIVIDDPSFPPEKKTVLMVVRQHGNEYGGSYILEGALDLLLDRERSGGVTPGGGVLEKGLGHPSRARNLRRVRWIIYPMMNPDGAVANVRYNNRGIDLNRDWARTGCNTGQEPETFAIQCDIESLDAIFDIDVAGDHHGWGNGNHGGFRYAQSTSPSNLTAPEYQEAKKDTDVIERHDPTQFAWIENGGTTGMLRVEMFLLSNFLLHTPEYDGTISTPEEFHAKGRGWARAMVDTLFAPRFTNASGTNIRLAKLGDGLHVTVDDADENLAPGARESVQVVVRDAASGDAETITLVETGFDTGIFRNETPLATSGGAATQSNGVLETSSGARVVARYVDDDYPRDASLDELRIR